MRDIIKFAKGIEDKESSVDSLNPTKIDKDFKDSSQIVQID